MRNRWLELIGKPMDVLGSPQQGMMAHVVAYSLWFTDVGIYGFEGRNWKLWPIDKLWMLFGLLAMGTIITY